MQATSQNACGSDFSELSFGNGNGIGNGLLFHLLIYHQSQRLLLQG